MLVDGALFLAPNRLISRRPENGVCPIGLSFATVLQHGGTNVGARRNNASPATIAVCFPSHILRADLVRK
jgi:hypothetical protein